MTDRNIVVEEGKYTPVFKREVELVERKGLGHPDSIIDGIMEEISKELSKEYLKEFGKILHHNVDKGQVCGGGTKVEFGGGVFTKPIYVLLTGRATEQAEGKTIPVQHIAQQTAHNYLKKAVRNLNIEADVEVESRISAGSADLVELFLRGPKVPYSNDTSFGTGFAPYTDLEKLVLQTEKHLNSDEYKSAHPEIGEDIKVMGLREKDSIRLTVACAFISKHVPDVGTYVNYKERVKEDVVKLAKSITDKQVNVFVNTGDDIENKSVYITLTGTSAEMGDDGSVGRGNRVNGLITPFRSMTLEAAAGKNPVNHVGKIYSVVATEMAESIAKENEHIADINVVLLSQIGKPIDQPKVASATVILNGVEYDTVKDKIRYEVDQRLENITEATTRIVEGKAGIF